MTIISTKCSKCGALIQMDDTKESGFCMHCGNRFLVKFEILRLSKAPSNSVESGRKEEVERLLDLARERIDQIFDDKFKKGVYFHLTGLYEGMVDGTALKKVQDEFLEKVLEIDPENHEALRLKELIRNAIIDSQNKFDEGFQEDEKRGKEYYIGYVLAYGALILLSVIFYFLVVLPLSRT